MEGGARGRMGGKAPTGYQPLICPMLIGLAYTLSLGHSLTSPNLWAFFADWDRKDLILLHYSLSSKSSA